MAVPTAVTADEGINSALKSPYDVVLESVGHMYTQFSTCRYGKSVRISRLACGVFAFLLSKVCPSSKDKKKQAITFVLGFILGSFIYMFSVSISYALHFEEDKYNNIQVRKLQNYANNITKGRSYLVKHSHTPKMIIKAKPGRIPHIIHQSWDTESIPIEFLPWMESWHQNHPHWKHVFWTKAGIHSMVEQHFPLIYNQVYKNYTSSLHRYLVNRYLILYQEGGVYADLDMESIKTLDALVMAHSCILTEQPLIHRAVLFDSSSPNYIVNSFMACEKGHPFLKFVLDMLDTYLIYDVSLEPWRERVEKTVGSLFLGDVYQLYKVAYNMTGEDTVQILPAEQLMPNYNERYRHMIVRRCLGGVLGAKGQETCSYLKRFDFSNKLPADAYNKCNWVDLFDPKVIERLSQGRTINIGQIGVES